MRCLHRAVAAARACLPRPFSRRLWNLEEGLQVRQARTSARETDVRSNLGRLAPPRTDGLGREPTLEEAEEAEADEPLVNYEDIAAEQVALRLKPVASIFHRHVEHVELDEVEPLPSDALEVEEDMPSISMRGPKRLRPEEARLERAPVGLLQRLAEVEKNERLEGGSRGRGRSRTKRAGQFEFNDEEPIRVRVLDVDALPLEEIHRAFMYTLVRRRPAEVCVRIASALAKFRDKPGQLAYQRLLSGTGKLFGSTHGPELLALFTRCYATISVPFMLDYTRQYGHFSRAFLAEQVEKSLRPGFFDFMRYEDQGGVRPLPLVISKPWSIQAYTRLMSKSYLKSRLYEQLKLHGHIPDLDKDTDPDLSPEVRVMEELGKAGALKVAERPAPAPASRAEVARPALLDAIMQAEHSGRGWSPDQATATPNARAPLRGVRRALAEVEIDLEESDKEEGFSDYYDEDEEEVSDDEGRSNRFGLQFERVVPESAYSVSAEDGLMMDPKQSNKRDYELEEVIADRWWSRLRRRFFRHNYRAHGLVEGQWQRVPDPRGPRYKPRKRHRSRLQKKEEKMKREMQSRSR